MSFKETGAETMTHETHDLHDDSPRSSMDSNESKRRTTPTSPLTPSVAPTIRLLFSFISRRHVLCLILPAVFVSIIAGAIAPFMTQVIGQAFDAFARFAAIQQPSQVVKDTLLRNVGIAGLTLIGLAFGSFALSSLTSCLWIWIGETNVLALRRALYVAVTNKNLAWFDTQLGSSDDETSVGAAGLMAKFSSETDEIRMATSLASGMLIQYLTTSITCLVLAFVRSWQLTLVILSALPLLVLVQGFSQAFARPLLDYERQQTATVATIIERAASAIATVKAFNAVSFELARATASFSRLRKAAGKLNVLWACTSGTSQFVIMAMFVQGFWFGSKLVRDGTISPGDVMAVFWACLIASSNLQMCIPQIIVLTKGKLAMASLVTLMSPPPSIHSSGSTILKLTPPICHGSFSLHNVSFAYPSRPETLVLNDVSLFLPANETTFIVGSSGSGKSTIAHLLQKLYEPQEGLVTLDEHDIRYLDDDWVRSHVGCVSQAGSGDEGVVVLDGRSVYHNIAAAVHGRPYSEGGSNPTKGEIEDVCRMALLHDFVRDMPEGYETILGGTDGAGKGVSLSGGQKQRLAIARARLRDPTVLILDEPTSALDVTSRLLIFEAVKQWRQNKTTIVITHDLTQIGSQDFVYVMKDGKVVEHGYRSSLEDDGVSVHSDCRGEFKKMLESQAKPNDASPTKKPKPTSRILSHTSVLSRFKSMATLHHQTSNASMRRATAALRHLTFGNWMLDVVADLTQSDARSAFHPDPFSLQRGATSFSGLPTDNYNLPEDIYTPVPERRRPSTTYAPTVDELLRPPTPAPTVHGKRFSLPLLSREEKPKSQLKIEKTVMEKSVEATRKARDGKVRKDTNANTTVKFASTDFKTTLPAHRDVTEDETHDIPGFWSITRTVFPLIPHKPLLVVGLIVCLVSGAMTPVFSFFLSRLLFEVSAGAQNTSTINTFGGIVLSIAAFDGIFLGLKYMIMETCGLALTNALRTISLRRILIQDKTWFDRSANAPSRLVQTLVKDGEDSRDLVAVVLGQCLVVGTMLGVGLVWAFVRGWQLTLAGLAIAPVFGVLMAVQSKLVARCEVGNKRARERVSKGYFDAIINIRGIKSMSLDSVFKAQFDASAEKALRAGVQGAFIEGCTYGLASGLIYLAEGLLFYVGALLIVNGTYSYLQMIEVLNLVVFSVTIGSQLLTFTEKTAKAVQATHDLHKLTVLDTDTRESEGTLRPEISGSINFKAVDFSYPGQDVSVLRNLNLRIRSGECVAVVGTSGSGKSTIASLLQRLYEPLSGAITVDKVDTRFMSTTHLRDHISVVSQQPHLFDATIAENIRYGRPSVTDVDVESAAKAAQLHEFIVSLPQGYQTHLGENASLISGGQVQRLQIARALARPSRILLLDECTSALDLENQASVLETLRWARYGRTVVMVTHKLEAMRMCDRILLVEDGHIGEQGTYEELMDKKGVFATLASGGEWLGSS
ncbi:P-loop containing nucleoside triphosphate hydrolase protein [Crepidotus variabilis]|uniref:P-loop containing nucleoside triphosphate hydrolase protein n=1 Tax=Crepidotus variabilis TaxID=179855 RepID=A0A9P6EG12_9AGAR|nr:P-loop containing nucleoside triphosphate hydrolase protein [Crepidotus variabilis]